MHAELMAQLSQVMGRSGKPTLDIFGSTTAETITEAEEILRATFPNDYRDFLLTYGSLGVVEDDIYGIVGTESAAKSSVVKVTVAEREESHLPHDLVIINCHYYNSYVCLNTAAIKKYAQACLLFISNPNYRALPSC